MGITRRGAVTHSSSPSKAARTCDRSASYPNEIRRSRWPAMPECVSVCTENGSEEGVAYHRLAPTSLRRCAGFGDDGRRECWMRGEKRAGQRTAELTRRRTRPRRKKHARDVIGDGHQNRRRHRTCKRLTGRGKPKDGARKKKRKQQKRKQTFRGCRSLPPVPPRRRKPTA